MTNARPDDEFMYFILDYAERSLASFQRTSLDAHTFRSVLFQARRRIGAGLSDWAAVGVRALRGAA